MLNSSHISLIKTAFCLIMVIPMLACTAGRNAGLSNENQIFPPDQLLPLKIAIARPIVNITHEVAHQSLEQWEPSPGQRRMLMNCTWNEGLINFVEQMVPGTKLFYLGAGRDPLSAVGSGVQVKTDSLGVVAFKLEEHSALDVARHRGWTHLVVPEHFNFEFENEGQDLILFVPVAIIDVQERRIVWQGTVDSRQISPKDLGADDELQPALTSYEATSYRFVLDLMEILNRQLNDRPQSRHQFASVCQKPAPLLQETD